MQPKLTMTDTPAPHLREAIVGPLIEFNNARASQPENNRSLVIILSNPDTGGILGGLWGATNFAHLHVDLLFVPEELRGTGLGRRMLLQAEREAITARLSGGMVGYIQLSGARVLRASGLHCVWHTQRLSARPASCLSVQGTGHLD
jgi:GNAT superfamily N-acetyltransferase